ncbi:pyruvate ferredoxin oxidoreductase [Candidatus Bathyarchaeota archaeon]|nr:pyruvate ferredoxin oxidoreductase [Candidatus Bathyarchaeota archaeon]
MVDYKDPKSTIAAVQVPSEGEAGKTGSWRSFKPVFNPEKCILIKSEKARCHICWMFCPEVAITKSRPPTINLDYCKGCGICSTECPHGAITMKKE